MNTKPHGEANLQKINRKIVAYQYYPPEGLVHYLLYLDQYNIEPHRESFLSDVKPEQFSLF